MEHIAIIMDGNRRYARLKGMHEGIGHEKGAEKVKEIAEAVRAKGVKFLTLFAFSSENWNRSKEEIEGLNALLEKFLANETEGFVKNKTKVRIIGDRTPYSAKIQQMLGNLEKLTESFAEFCLIIALNYGGRDEILNTVNSLDGKKVTKEEFESKLYTAGLPEPELLIRTGGAKRLSNFLLWQMAYTELYFTDVLWPEFSSAELEKAIDFFTKQKRNFGK